MNALSFIFVVLVLMTAGCGSGLQHRKITLETTGLTTVVVTGVSNQEEVKLEAARRGVSVRGDEVLTLAGQSDAIEALSFKSVEGFDYLVDSPIEASLEAPESVDDQLLYLAKKDMGVLELWKSRPLADGRRVKVGVIDDGISPHQSGFNSTPTGERKFLKKGSNSSFSTFTLVESDTGLTALIDEKRPSYSGQVDLNADGKTDSWSVFVPSGTETACIDLDGDRTYGPAECKGSFSKTGEYFLLKDQRLALIFELDLAQKKIQFFQPERGGDSHGEGVAGVMAGHRIGNLDSFDGVAPGAAILDYDLSEASDQAAESEYSLATFLTALEWLGKEGADVANVSYSLFFTSARTQTFMAKAIDRIVRKYNMVVSFSAGNNGPGLGSLNRRGIYPSSVLVAGAYVSKELDEVVHGVTGLPEEGRVVHYSSRGPGLGVGPLLITPLSSLVPSTPDSGHRAFSGTSSASPALAGTAAVLISALKQDGIPVDAVTVIQALRLSGKRLKNEPFIFQGYGLPRVDRAYEIYKDLIRGSLFGAVNISTEESTDGVAHGGIVVLRSKEPGILTRRVNLSGVISPLAPAETRVNLLTPVRIEYPIGMSGPRVLWVSSSRSSFSVDIDPEAASVHPLEDFLEIKIFSAADDRLLAIVPVTLIRDQDVNLKPTAVFKISAQEGLRFPLQVPAGVRGIRVSHRLLEGESRNLQISAFDPNGIRTQQMRLNSELWIPTPKSGFYQIGLAMAGGTSRSSQVELRVEPVDLMVSSRLVHEKEGVIPLINRGAPISGTLRLTPETALIGRVTVSSKDLPTGAVMTAELPKGAYTLNLQSFSDSELAYPFINCSVQETQPNGTVKLSNGQSFSVDGALSKVWIRCMPFELGAEFDKKTDWELRLEQRPTPLTKRIDAVSGQSVETKFEALPAGRYSVEILDPHHQIPIPIGKIEVL